MNPPRIYSNTEIAAALGHIRRVLLEGATPLHPITRRSLRALNTAVIELQARRADASPAAPPVAALRLQDEEEC